MFGFLAVSVLKTADSPPTSRRISGDLSEWNTESGLKKQVIKSDHGVSEGACDVNRKAIISDDSYRTPSEEE